MYGNPASELVNPRLVDGLLIFAALLVAGQAIVMYTTEGGWTWLVGAVPLLLFACWIDSVTATQIEGSD